MKEPRASNSSGFIILILILIIGYLIYDKVNTQIALEKERQRTALAPQSEQEKADIRNKPFPLVEMEDSTQVISPEQKKQNLECEKLGEDFYNDKIGENSLYFESSHKTALLNGTCYVAIGGAGGLDIRVNEFDIHPYEVIYDVKTGEIFRIMGTTLVRSKEGNLKPVCLASLNGTQKGLYKCLDLEVREVADIEKGIFN